MVFPDAQLFGCDVNETALKSAMRTYGHVAKFFYSSETNIINNGPYDLICALSSLCRHPPPANINDVFRFEDFESIIKLLVANIRPDGALALYNASYLLQWTQSADEFVPLRSDVICRNGFVSLYDESGRVLLESVVSPAGLATRRLHDAQRLKDFDIVDSVFVKRSNAAGPIYVTLYDPCSRGANHKMIALWERSELDAFEEAQRNGIIDMRRRYTVFQNSDDRETLYEITVSRPKLHGGGHLHLATYGPLSLVASCAM